MRFFRNEKRERTQGYRSGFLLLPKRIGKETRWLEWASWRVEVVSYIHQDPNQYGMWLVKQERAVEWVNP